MSLKKFHSPVWSTSCNSDLFWVHILINFISKIASMYQVSMKNRQMFLLIKRDQSLKVPAKSFSWSFQKLVSIFVISRVWHFFSNMYMAMFWWFYYLSVKRLNFFKKNLIPDTMKTVWYFRVELHFFPR